MSTRYSLYNPITRVREYYDTEAEMQQAKDAFMLHEIQNQTATWGFIAGGLLGAGLGYLLSKMLGVAAFFPMLILAVTGAFLLMRFFVRYAMAVVALFYLLVVPALLLGVVGGFFWLF